MYRIDDSVEDGLAFLTICSSKTGCRARICPSLGGTVMSICLRGNTGMPLELLKADDSTEIRENPLFRGRILFPFNDRIPSGIFRFQDRTYQLPINADDGSAIHGFVYKREMAMVEQRITRRSAQVTLATRIDPHAYPGYPFDMELRITYIVEENQFVLRTEVENRGRESAPYALGWHPYFAFETDAPGAGVLTGAWKTYVEVDEHLWPTRRILSVTGTPWDFSSGRRLEQMTLDLGFSAAEDGVTRLSRKGGTVEIWQDTAAFPFTQLFLPPDGNSIAVEPITGATNSFNIEELGLRTLAPRTCDRGEVTIRLI